MDSSTSREFAKVRGEIASLKGEMDKHICELQNESAELKLLVQTLMQVLRDTGVVEPEVFNETWRKIDASDGFADGRVTTPKLRRADPNIKNRID